MIVCLYIYRSHKTNNCALCISRALYVKNVIVYPISLIYLRKTIGENKLQLKNITVHFHMFSVLKLKLQNCSPVAASTFYSSALLVAMAGGSMFSVVHQSI